MCDLLISSHHFKFHTLALAPMIRMHARTHAITQIPEYNSTRTPQAKATPTCKREGSPPSQAGPLPCSPPLCTQTHTCTKDHGERSTNRSSPTPFFLCHTTTHFPSLTPQVALAPAHRYAKLPVLLPQPPRPSAAMLKCRSELTVRSEQSYVHWLQTAVSHGEYQCITTTCIQALPTPPRPSSLSLPSTHICPM